jgi:hypothetical protein
MIIVSQIEREFQRVEAQPNTGRSGAENRLLVRIVSICSIFAAFTCLAFLVDRLQVTVYQLEVFSTIAPIRRRELHLERDIGAR